MQENWELLAGLIAVGAGLWQYIRGFFGWIANLVVSTRRADEDTSRIIIGYLATGRGMARAPAYGSRNAYVRPLKGHAMIAYQDFQVSGQQIFWHKGRPIRYFQEKDGAPDGFDSTFTFFRGTVDWERLVIDAMAWKTESGQKGYTQSRHRVIYHHGRSFGGEMAEQQRSLSRGGSSREAPEYRFSWDDANAQRLLKWKASDIGSEDIASLDGLGLSPEIEQVVQEIRLWFQSKDWYQRRRLPWRRGYMFHGVPGTGKTTLARELSIELDLPVHFMDLASMSNEDLRDAWNSATKDAPCMVLVEDIDAVFEGRENVSPGGGMMASGGLTFDCLLNCIDGIERSGGVLFVVTTNNVGKIDDALTREGRVDRMVEFPSLKFPERLKVAHTILGKTPSAARLAQESGDIPASKFVELCCRDALKELYRSDKTDLPDPELRKEILK